VVTYVLAVSKSFEIQCFSDTAHVELNSDIISNLYATKYAHF